MYGPEGAVLGATTTTAAALTLANTGISSILSLIVGFAVVASGLLTLANINKRKATKK